MNKEKVSKFVNPLWMIVILLAVISFLLFGISQRIGHDYNRETNTMPSGLYNAIRGTTPNIPNYHDDLKDIKNTLESIDGRVGSIELKVRDIWLHY